MQLGDSAAHDADFFGSLGETRQAPSAPAPAEREPRVSARELNPMLNPDAQDTQHTVPLPREEKKFGAPGHKWRMMKLRRTLEMADESGISIEEIATERYGSLAAFEEAIAERDFLKGSQGERGTSQAGRRASAFRRPGEAAPACADAIANPAARSATATARSIPSVLAPVAPSHGLLSVSELNKLEAKVLRAEMTGLAEAGAMRAELEQAKVQAASGDASVEALPVLDGYGRMYDIGTSTTAELDAAQTSLSGGRRAMAKQRAQLAATQSNDESLTDLIRQEKFSAGSKDQKQNDAALAYQITADHGFQNDLEYMDDEAQRFARKKMRDDAMKRQFALNDYARTKHALDTCTFCWQDEGRIPPKANIISSSSYAYLALPDREPLVEGHCWIVPTQHNLSSLDVDEDGWTEIRNYMKCLFRMAAARNQSMLFFETVLSFRQQKHTYLEAVPIPLDLFQEIPAYFKTALAEVESEWSDHKQVIQFTEARPFQRSMVSKLPYFMVQWDYKGQRGYGHVIEARDDGAGRASLHAAYEEPSYDDGDHIGGAGFPKWFAQEIIGNLLDLEPYRWRSPRHIKGIGHCLAQFHAMWDPYDWTRQVDL
ncbi:Pre-mRNA-splicing factor cwf19 [Malassezia vespertilionis]|nr:Pre-mRNA-splicing factor cwf19 [Malassezia vespertilionis]WFD06962.1 Pre-mRNA-splicing factor cwf19 [Malassezia vespertilionis]